MVLFLYSVKYNKFTLFCQGLFLTLSFSHTKIVVSSLLGAVNSAFKGGILRRGKGCIRVVPGSHRWGLLNENDGFNKDMEGQRRRMSLPEGGAWQEVPLINGILAGQFLPLHDHARQRPESYLSRVSGPPHAAIDNGRSSAVGTSAAAGNVMRKVVPSLGTLTTRISPP
jgi:hypothetical protein